MGVEGTMTIKRSDALAMLEAKGVTTYEDDGDQRLEALLYENRENPFENYSVVCDSWGGDGSETWKHWW